MTGYTVHTGASEEFINNWDQIFGNKKQEKPEEKKATGETGKKKRKKNPKKEK